MFAGSQRQLILSEWFNTLIRKGMIILAGKVLVSPLQIISEYGFPLYQLTVERLPDLSIYYHSGGHFYKIFTHWEQIFVKSLQNH